MNDVAAAAGVSRGTVSNVLNHPHLVSGSTVDAVQRAIEELGFVRNESARHLKAGTSRTIALIVLDISNPFFTDIARGVEEAASASGLAVLLCNSAERPDKEAAFVELLQEHRVQGVLMASSGRYTSQLQRMRERGTPVILLDHPFPAQEHCSVVVDHEAGGRLAAEHLLSVGHRAIAFVGAIRYRQVQQRMQAARDHLGQAGHTLEVLETDGLDVGAGRQAARALLGRPAVRRPSAIFCANDLLALGVLQEAMARGSSVPDDLAVMGYDDIPYAAAAAVPLSSIGQSGRQIGRLGATLLVEEVAEAEAHRHRAVELQPVLRARASTGAVAGPDADGEDIPVAVTPARAARAAGTIEEVSWRCS
jgi:LacI family transcriptional regulator